MNGALIGNRFELIYYTALFGEKPTWWEASHPKAALPITHYLLPVLSFPRKGGGFSVGRFLPKTRRAGQALTQQTINSLTYRLTIPLRSDRQIGNQAAPPFALQFLGVFGKNLNLRQRIISNLRVIMTRSN